MRQCLMVIASILIVIATGCSTRLYEGSLTSSIYKTGPSKGAAYSTVATLYIHGFGYGQPVYVDGTFIGRTSGNTCYFVSEGFLMSDGDSTPGWSGTPLSVKVGNAFPVEITDAARWFAVYPAGKEGPSSYAMEVAGKGDTSSFVPRPQPVYDNGHGHLSH